MHSTTRPGWARLPIGVAAFGLYCVAGSALVSHLVANAVDGTAATRTDREVSDRLASLDARSTPQRTAVVPARVMVSIVVREGPTDSSTVLCATRADRVARDVIEIGVEDFAQLYVDLECNLQPPTAIRE